MAAPSTAGLHRRSPAESVKDGQLEKNEPLDLFDSENDKSVTVTGEITFTSDSGNQQFTFPQEALLHSTSGSALGTLLPTRSALFFFFFSNLAFIPIKHHRSWP